MFENSQPEESSKTGLIVGGTIAVVMIAFGIYYMTHLSQAPEGTPAPAAGAAAAARPTATPEDITAANPLIDLQIVQNSLGRDNQTQTMAMWTVRVVNRSRVVAYRNIQFETNYYGAQQNLLSTRGGAFPEMMGPGDQKTFSQINDGLYPPGTASFTIGIKSADAGQP
jgi:hypothetical protein